LATAVTLVSLSAGQAFSQSSALTPELIEDVKAKVDANVDQLIAIFKDIQANPELGST
jgi:hypothetical protein